MAVKLRLAITEGWKATDNKRFGEVMELQFYSDRDGRLLFKYAPKLEDKQVFDDMFEKLFRYDNKLKELKNIVSEIDGKLTFLYGECNKEEKPQEAK